MLNVYKNVSSVYEKSRHQNIYLKNGNDIFKNIKV